MSRKRKKPPRALRTHVNEWWAFQSAEDGYVSIAAIASTKAELKAKRREAKGHMDHLRIVRAMFIRSAVLEETEKKLRELQSLASGLHPKTGQPIPPYVLAADIRKIVNPLLDSITNLLW